jgi:hypothetical protein
VNAKTDPGQGSQAFLTQAVSADGIHVTLTGRNIRLRFSMRDCQLYAFQFLQSEK